MVKSTSFKLLLASTLAVSAVAYADENTLDIAYAFGDNNVQIETLNTQKMTETQGAAIIHVYNGGEDHSYIYDDVTDEVLCRGKFCSYYHIDNADDDRPQPNFRFYYPSQDNQYGQNGEYPHIPNYNNYNQHYQPWIGVVLNLAGRFMATRGVQTLTSHHTRNATLVTGVIKEGVKHNNEKQQQ